MTHQEILQALNTRTKNTLMETLGIVYTEMGPDFLVATMPVTTKVHQPMGLLHGGASAALAESVGSAASALLVNPKENAILGLEITARHLKSARDGMLTATARIKNQGKTIHLWEIEIHDQHEQLISICHLTTMVKPLAPQKTA